METTTTAPAIAQTQVRTRLPFHEVEAVDNGQKVRVYLPGAAKDSIDLNVDSSKLILTASVTEEALPENAKVVHREIDSGNFKITFELGERIDVEKIAATYENGVLQIDLPYIPERTKTISIA